MQHIQDDPIITNTERTGYPNGEPHEYLICPKCGEEAEVFFMDVYDNDVVGCDRCIEARDAWEVIAYAEL